MAETTLCAHPFLVFETTDKILEFIWEYNGIGNIVRGYSSAYLWCVTGHLEKLLSNKKLEEEKRKEYDAVIQKVC